MLPFTKQELEDMIRQKYVSVQKHPKVELYIYNYTQNAQFDSVWNNVTMNSRGLILDGDFNIVARPFKKFFNYEEHLEKPSLQGQIPTDEVPHMLLKYDGSMGIMYWIDNKPYIATRGSFTSDQAIRGTKILYEKYSDCFDKLRQINDENKTIIFEIIFPENRIVVDYGGREDLIQLAIIDNKTGRTLSNGYLGFPRAEEFRNVNFLSLDEIKELDMQNQEGFVCYYPNADFRMKIKFKNYLQLHKIMIGVSSISIWEYLKEGNYDMDDILQKVPDEFFEWVKNTKDKLLRKYWEMRELAEHLFRNRPDSLKTRKDFALWAKERDVPATLLFNLLDENEELLTQNIWKMLRPEYEQPFKTKIDDNS